MHCTHCGKEVGARDEFCVHCGKSLSAAKAIDGVTKSDGTGAGSGTHESVAPQEVRNIGKTSILYGLALIAFGGLATWIGYSITEGGGTYIVFWGAILYGGYMLLRGISYYFYPKQKLKNPRE